MKRRDFILGLGSLITLPLIYEGSRIYLNKSNIKDDFYIERMNPKTSVSHVEVNLVYHCNLNCKYCSHFSCIADNVFYDINQYKTDITQLSNLTNSKIQNIQLLGGEPLLHPDINKFMEITRKLFPHSEIDILTNGILLQTIDDSFYKTATYNHISILPSIYPVDIDWKLIIKRAKEFDTNLAFDLKSKPKLTLNNVEKNKITKFYKINLDIKGSQDVIKSHKRCWHKEVCACMLRGKIFPCSIVSNIQHFNKKFKLNLEAVASDYLDIYEAKNLEDIKKFLNSPIPFCKYCKETTAPVKWEVTKEHTIDEWT